MAEQSLQSDQNIEYHLVAMFEKLENLRTDSVKNVDNANIPVRVEMRTLEFWRAVISECLSSFIYVFIVCGTFLKVTEHMALVDPLRTALASGFAMTSLTQCFGHISGAHINPAVSLAMGVIKRISIFRTLMFILAQCGGGIAGAFFLFGPDQANTTISCQASAYSDDNESPWKKFGIEFMLTFIVVFAYFISMDTYRKWTGTSSLTIGATYSACSLVSMPHLNPSRSLGPSFVCDKWRDHWVYWVGPLCGGIASSLIYEYIFNPRRHKKAKDSQDDESSSIRSDDIDTFDDIDKPAPPKFHGSNYNTYRASAGVGASTYCGSLYSAPAAKLERGESIYGGTKSLYCNSPPLTRANLNRSQSVYAKSNTAIHKELLPRPGPLVPTQSMYPLRVNQHSHINNQNVQNQLQQKSEGIYGVRSVAVTRPEPHVVTTTTIERERTFPTNDRPRRDNHPVEIPYGPRGPPDAVENKTRGSTRPESVYGWLGAQSRRVQSSVPSDDSCYSSYTGNSSSRNACATSANPALKPTAPGYSGRNCNPPENRPNQVPPPQIVVNGASSNSYHHQHSPNPQY